jgi:hypothetical protein
VLREHARQQPGWRVELHVTSVRLDPAYPAAYFDPPAVPDGVRVYHVRDGKITRSYVQGAPGTPSERARRPTPASGTRFAYLAAAAALLAIAALLLRPLWKVARRQKGRAIPES